MEEANEENLSALISNKVFLNLEIHKDEFLRATSLCQLVKSMDKNSAFFHKFASQRRSWNRIRSIEFKDGRTSRDEGETKNLAR